MSKKAIVINYHNFHASKGTQLFIDSLIREIHQELPDGSTIKATFSKKDDVVKGMLQVGSYAGPFFAVAASDNLNEVTVRLVDQIRRRIEKWKSKRHDRHGIKTVELKPYYENTEQVGA
ncbi:hypothetical protein K2P97_11080 [bacterium]|nr:hypothetical protein [bacterium]